jgi:hypothetical protein
MADFEKRESLKIIGAIGVTCSFPFAADELHGQTAETAAHQHHAPGKQAAAGPVEFFTAAEARLMDVLVDRIIPDGATPGARAAGVTAYIDLVIRKQPAQQKLYRAGLAWLNERAGGEFAALGLERQLEILRPLCDAADRGTAKSQPERFFAALKNMTCDGYYTSKIGMTEELGFTGPSVLAAFPSCEIPEH